jgi:hypothetical protein
MADVYCYSGAAGTGSGADWTNAYTTLAAALTGAGAGGKVYIASDHSETPASSITLAASTNAAQPNQILSVTRAGSTPPVAADLTAGASIAPTGVVNISPTGFAYCWGVSFSVGSGGNNANFLLQTGSDFGWIFENCTLKLNNTQGSSAFLIGNNSIAGKAFCKFINTTLQFGATTQRLKLQNVRFEWLNTASAIAGATFPAALIQSGDGVGTIASIRGVDLSALGSNSIFDISKVGPAKLELRGCKLGSSFSLTTGSIASTGAVFLDVVNCDSGSTNYKERYYRYAGDIQDETTIVRSGGASDGTTAKSWKLATNASASLINPLESPPILVWNETTGSSVTVTACVVTDNVTLKDDECWIEVEYLGTSGNPLASTQSDRKATVLTTAANQTTDGTSSWTTTGLTTPVKQTLDVSFTPQKKGLFRATVKLAKASTTAYLDPKLTVA